MGSFGLGCGDLSGNYGFNVTSLFIYLVGNTLHETMPLSSELIQQYWVTTREELPTARDIIERQSTIWCIAHYDRMTASVQHFKIHNKTKKTYMYVYNKSEVNSTYMYQGTRVDYSVFIQIMFSNSYYS